MGQLRPALWVHKPGTAWSFPGLCDTHNPATSIRVHVTVHLHGPADVTIQVDCVEATGSVAVLLNLTAVRGVWETSIN
jgi:hypothetical protein